MLQKWKPQLFERQFKKITYLTKRTFVCKTRRNSDNDFKRRIYSKQLDLPCTPEPFQGGSCILLLPLPDKPLGGVREEDEDEKEVNKTVESEADGEEGDGHQGRDGRVAEQAKAEGGHVTATDWPTQSYNPHLIKELNLTMRSLPL